MRSLESFRLDQRDPSRLKATEDRRARIAEQDITEAIDAAVKRVSEGGITNPVAIQAIVEEELGRYSSAATSKGVEWSNDTLQRSVLRAEQLLKASGVKVIGMRLGPRPIAPDLKNALTINVRNQIESLTASTKAKVTSALIEGVNAGEGMRVIAKRVSEATGMERSRAVLIARTETMRAHNQVNEDLFKKNGIATVEWLAAMDERTCDVCGAHHGKKYPISDHPEIPAHPNCRCILLPVIEEVA